LDYWMERLSNAEVVAQGSLGVLNRGVFLDFIRQLRVWKDEAEAREEMLLEQQDTPLSQLRQKAHIRCLSQLQQEGSVEVSDFTRQFAQVEDWTDSAQRIFCTYPAERMINALQLSHREGVTIR
jgi:hypothetical protein